jgi:hypothetical protein
MEVNVLTHESLAALERRLHDREVLSVYIDGHMTDPAMQRAWRRGLDQRIEAVRDRLKGDPGGDAESFERCVELLEAELSRFTGALGSDGWMAFITTSGISYAGTLPIAVPTRVVWGKGIRITPCLRSLKHGTPVVIEVVDAAEVRLYRYWNNELEALRPVRAEVPKGVHEHMGTPPRTGFHPGVHGETGHDAARRDADEAMERMLAAATEQAVRLANHVGWILIAGVPRARALAARVAGATAPGRVLELDSLDVHATEANLVEAARTGASAIRNANDGVRIAGLIDRSGPHGRATLGRTTTRRALELGRVRELFITQHFIDGFESDAEFAVARAFRQAAGIEVVSGSAAERLDEYGGIGARLKFAQPEAAA